MGHVVIGFTRRLGAPATTLPVSDTFNRADDGSSLGTSDSGHVWQVLNGTWGISSNQAFTPATAVNDPVAVIETGASDVTIQVTLTNRETGIVFRATDNSNYFEVEFNIVPANIQVWKKQAGAFAQVGAGAAATMVSGDVMKVVLSGSSITVFKNGSSIYSTTSTFNQTATKHGLYKENTNTVGTFNDFSIV